MQAITKDAASGKSVLLRYLGSRAVALLACGSPYAISATLLAVSYDKLLGLMLEAFAKYKKL